MRGDRIQESIDGARVPESWFGVACDDCGVSFEISTRLERFDHHCWNGRIVSARVNDVRFNGRDGEVRRADSSPAHPPMVRCGRCGNWTRGHREGGDEHCGACGGIIHPRARVDGGNATGDDPVQRKGDR